MRQKSGTREPSSERLVKNIRRVTRKQYSSEEKIRIVLDGLRGEFSIAELCRREGIAEGVVTLLNDRAVNWHRTQAQAVKRWRFATGPLRGRETGAMFFGKSDDVGR